MYIQWGWTSQSQMCSSVAFLCTSILTCSSASLSILFSLQFIKLVVYTCFSSLFSPSPGQRVLMTLWSGQTPLLREMLKSTSHHQSLALTLSSTTIFRRRALTRSRSYNTLRYTWKSKYQCWLEVKIRFLLTYSLMIRSWVNDTPFTHISMLHSVFSQTYNRK